MTLWSFLDKRWPSERGWVTIATFVLAGAMLKMAEVHPSLWDVELFKILLQAVIVTGILGMVLAFHFAANKSDETKAENTGKLAEAFTAVATGTPPPTSPPAAQAAQVVADAAQDKADEIGELPRPMFGGRE